MKLSACRRLSTAPMTGSWCRTIRITHWQTRLSARHSRNTVGRFNAGTPESPSFQILYLAEDFVSALFEVGALLGDRDRPINNPRLRTVPLLLSLQVILHHVADLTDQTQQRLIGTTEQELTGLWNRYDVGDAPTQRLGKVLFDRPDLEGFLAPSAAQPGARNLIVFPEKLVQGSKIELYNEESGQTERLKP